MRMHKAKLLTLSAAVVATGVATAHKSGADSGAFGSAEETAFAENLGRALVERDLVGDGAVQTHPYAGTSKHGPVVQYIDGTLSVGDETGVFILKRNYRGEDVSVEEVFRDPNAHFDSTAVMFRRDEGYAPKKMTGSG